MLSADHPFDVYIAGVLTLCFFCAVAAAVTGLVQGHQPGAPPVNFWDEVLAYCLVAALARAAARIFG